MPGAAKWLMHEFSVSRSNRIRPGMAFSLRTAPAMRRTLSSSAIGSHYVVKLETEMLQQTSITKQLAAEVTEERDRLDQIGHSDVSLPADHVVWSVLASPGSTVTEGQTVLDLADCVNQFVVVDLPNENLNKLSPTRRPKCD